jgi:uncharacterized membrane protein
MAQKEQAHRHSLENRQTDADISLACRGQFFGWVLALVAVCGAIYLLAKGESTTGLVLLGGVVASFGGAFVYDRYQKSQSAQSDEEDENESREDSTAANRDD